MISKALRCGECLPPGPWTHMGRPLLGPAGEVWFNMIWSYLLVKLLNKNSQTPGSKHGPQGNASRSTQHHLVTQQIHVDQGPLWRCSCFQGCLAARSKRVIHSPALLQSVQSRMSLYDAWRGRHGLRCYLLSFLQNMSPVHLQASENKRMNKIFIKSSATCSRQTQTDKEPCFPWSGSSEFLHKHLGISQPSLDVDLVTQVAQLPQCPCPTKLLAAVWFGHGC